MYIQGGRSEKLARGEFLACARRRVPELSDEPNLPYLDAFIAEGHALLDHSRHVTRGLLYPAGYDRAY